jgi:hypothetical protein
VPPKPAPATIVVYKYTCDPGYEGVYYNDFVNACLEQDQLTNNVTFRVSGTASAVKVTGAGGTKGQATFANLPAGNYIVSEDVPSGIVTTYGFCGPTLDSATVKAVNNQMHLTLTPGSTWYCGYFNVPDDLSDSRGAILVQKFECDAASYPANFNYEANCSPTATTAKFALSYWDGSKYVPRVTGVTNEDGLLRFSQLQPGTYQLKEVGSTWCHAEADDVNAKGDLIVRAGQRTTVWIYNCVPPRQPPNTGTGTAAGTMQPGAVLTSGGLGVPGALALGLVWPMLALAGGLALRRRRAA